MKWAFFLLMIIMIVTDKPTNNHAMTHTHISLYVRLGQYHVVLYVKWDTLNRANIL